MKADILKKHYLVKLRTNIVNAVFGFITIIIVPRALGVSAFGDFEGVVDFGGGALSNAGTTGSSDMFVARFSADGSHVWSVRFGDTASTGEVSEVRGGSGGRINSFRFRLHYVDQLRGSQDVSSGSGSPDAHRRPDSRLFQAPDTASRSHIRTAFPSKRWKAVEKKEDRRSPTVE